MLARGVLMRSSLVRQRIVEEEQRVKTQMLLTAVALGMAQSRNQTSGTGVRRRACAH
jgi:hypothetical protein